MRLSNRFGWALITLSIPLAHCATGEDPTPVASGSAGTPSFSGSGGSSGTFVSGGTPSFAGNGPGAAGRPVFGGSGMAGEGSGGTVTGGTGGGSGGKVAGGGRPASCADMTKNGSETDRDCGGTVCDACDEGLVCKVAGDCVSGQCVSLKCAPEHCGDATANEDETDEDCGGPSCKPCAMGAACGAPADCEGRNCDAGKCGEPTHCVFGWQTDMKCGTSCLNAVQSNQKACSVVLDCYVANDCSPTTCGANEQKCGGNTLGLDSTPFPIAKTVYDCMCP